MYSLIHARFLFPLRLSECLRFAFKLILVFNGPRYRNPWWLWLTRSLFFSCYSNAIRSLFRCLIQNIYSIRYEWVTRIRNEKPVKNRFIRCETLLWQHLLHFVTSRDRESEIKNDDETQINVSTLKRVSVRARARARAKTKKENKLQQTNWIGGWLKVNIYGSIYTKHAYS